MLLPFVFSLGFWLGWRRAARRGGDRLDRLQYGAVHAIAITLLTLALSILAARMGWI